MDARFDLTENRTFKSTEINFLSPYYDMDGTDIYDLDTVVQSGISHIPWKSFPSSMSNLEIGDLLKYERIEKLLTANDIEQRLLEEKRKLQYEYDNIEKFVYANSCNSYDENIFKYTFINDYINMTTYTSNSHRNNTFSNNIDSFIATPSSSSIYRSYASYHIQSYNNLSNELTMDTYNFDIDEFDNGHYDNMMIKAFDKDKYDVYYNGDFYELDDDDDDYGARKRKIMSLILDIENRLITDTLLIHPLCSETALEMLRKLGITKAISKIDSGESSVFKAKNFPMLSIDMILTAMNSKNDMLALEQDIQQYKKRYHSKDTCYMSFEEFRAEFDVISNDDEYENPLHQIPWKSMEIVMNSERENKNRSFNRRGTREDELEKLFNSLFNRRYYNMPEKFYSMLVNRIVAMGEVSNDVFTLTPSRQIYYEIRTVEYKEKFDFRYFNKVTIPWRNSNIDGTIRPMNTWDLPEWLEDDSEVDMPTDGSWLGLTHLEVVPSISV